MDAGKLKLFESSPIPKAVISLAVPTVVSMIVTVLYNMVDTFFVGQTGDPNQMAAVSIVTPVFLFFMAAGNIFGIGGASYTSRSLGEKKYERVKHISSFCLYAGIITGILGALLMLACMTPLLHAVGTSENTFDFSRSYLTWIALGGPAIVTATLLTNLIRGEGSAKSSMVGMMAGTITNIILDPVFILKSFWGIPGLGMGVAGAAIATVLGNIVSIIVYFVHIISKKSVLSIHFKYFSIHDGILRQVLAIGLPASSVSVLMSLSNILMNNMLVTYGDIPVASMGIAMKANMLAIFVQMGFAMGIQPLIGFNFGAKNYRRMKDVMKFTAVCVFISGTILTIIYFIYSRPIVSFFINDESVIEMGITTLHALMCSTPLLGIMFVFSFSFQGMGKGKEALTIAISRQGFIFLPCVILLNKFFQLRGLIYSQPIADIVSVAMSFVIFLHINKGLKTQEKAAAQ
ncbi:MAG: MATE family efflux transporter [Treponema sp.]|nr:MATE family efflux transporter [Treponema sp.]